MNDFGMPTLIELPDIEDCAELCSELGLQFIEINMCLPQFQSYGLDTDKLSRLSEKFIMDQIKLYRLLHNRLFV